MTSTALPRPPAPARPVSAARARAVLVLGSLVSFVPNLDLTALNQAIPQLSRALHPSGEQIVWISDMYGFALAALLVTMGWLGDRIGRKRLLLAAVAGFGGASALTAYAGSAGSLIAARALLGVAGAGLMPSALSLIRNAFSDPKRRAAAVGIFGGVGAAGVGFGPVVAGLMLRHFWWGSVFLVNVPVMGLVLGAGAVLLPESRNPEAGRHRLDLASVPLSAAGVLGLVYGFSAAARYGFHQGRVIGSLAAGGICLGLFLLRQPRVAEPLIDVRLFRLRAFSGSVAANLVGMFALVAQSLLFSLYFQQVLGWSPLKAGLLALPGSVLAAAGGAAAAPLVTAVGRARTAALGMALGSVGFALYGLLGATADYPVLLLAMAPASFGVGVMFAVTMDTVLATVPGERAGAASGISETANELGAALGVAVLGTVLNTVYRHSLHPPAGLDTATVRAARTSLGNALDRASALPGRLGADLADAAKQAYLAGMHAALLVSTVVIAVMAVVSLLTLRGIPALLADAAGGTAGTPDADEAGTPGPLPRPAEGAGSRRD